MLTRQDTGFLVVDSLGSRGAPLLLGKNTRCAHRSVATGSLGVSDGNDQTNDSRRKRTVSLGVARAHDALDPCHMGMAKAPVPKQKFLLGKGQIWIRRASHIKSKEGRLRRLREKIRGKAESTEPRVKSSL